MRACSSFPRMRDCFPHHQPKFPKDGIETPEEASFDPKLLFFCSKVVIKQEIPSLSGSFLSPAQGLWRLRPAGHARGSLQAQHNRHHHHHRHPRHHHHHHDNVKAAPSLSPLNLCAPAAIVFASLAIVHCTVPTRLVSSASRLPVVSF